MRKTGLVVLVVAVLLIPNAAVWAAPADGEREVATGWWDAAWSRVAEAVSRLAGAVRLPMPESTAAPEEGQIDGDDDGSPASDPNG